jgi:hypothetical protein
MMSGLALGGAVTVVFAWALATRALVREAEPARTSFLPGVRGFVVLGICLAAGLGGCWGPAVHRSTEVELLPGGAGSPGETVTREVRTPVGTLTRTVELGVGGERLREVRTRRYHLPLTLIGVVLWAGWLQVRRRRRAPAAALASIVLIGSLVPACGGAADLPDREERVIREVSWDTLLVVESGPDDSLLFDVRRVAADRHGIRVLDGSGYRVAMVDWEGRLRWYAGRRGSGPGEFSNPRALAVDGEGRSWVLDVEAHRITGVSTDGRIEAEVPLFELEFVPHEFAVDGPGERFFFARPDEGIRPVEVRRDGRVRSGPRVRFPGSRDAASLALQGDVRSEPGSERWVMALSMGDGLLRFRGLEVLGPLRPWVEEVPLATVEVTVEGNPGSGNFSRTQRVVDPVFAAQSGAVLGSRVLVRFGGRTEHRHRLLDIYDLDEGSYRGSLLLPTAGWVAAWNDRIVLGRNTPHPQLLVLRPSEWP